MATQQDGGFAPARIDEDLPNIFEGRIWNDTLFSGNMACARTVSEHLGPFDQRLGVGGPYYTEDNDYGFRALEAGYRIRYALDGPCISPKHGGRRRATRGSNGPMAWVRSA